jgi:nitrite reductase/ring-hydroxylating ferredoxin subunit
VLVALGLESLTAARSPHAVWETLVTMKGRWVLVATTDELPVGAVRSFVAGSLQGVLVHDESHYYALSRVCTHMGCRLAYGDGERTLLCPCHGARFDLYGRSLAGPIGTDALLPPLPHIKTRVRGRLIEVYSV